MDFASHSERRPPAVSVVIPAYRVAAFIADALDSVFAQTFTDFEVIVVNDGSPDTEALEQALAPYRDRIRYIRQANAGVSAARNTAIRQARGDLIAQLDADDVWEREHLERQVAFLRGHPDIDMVYANATYFGERRAGRMFMDDNPSDGAVDFESLVLGRCVPYASTVVVSRAVLERVGLYNPALHVAEDFDLWLRVARSGGRIAYQRAALARYRQREASLSADPVPMLEGALHVLASLENPDALTATEQRARAERMAQFQADLGILQSKRALLAGDTNEALRALQESQSARPSVKTGLILTALRLMPGLVRSLYQRQAGSRS